MDYQEYRQSLNQRLTDKVQRELSSFREEMQAKTPQEIYDAAYQIAIKNEIADCFSNADYSLQAAKALMKSPNLLQDIYRNGLGGRIPTWRIYARPLLICRQVKKKRL